MSDKSITFVVSYLLGVDLEYLRNNYELDYENSNKCESFQNYLDVNILRHLNIVRQSVLHNKSQYKNKTIPDTIKDSVEYLKSRNIDIEECLNTLSLNNFFNALSEMINVILLKCLVDLDIPCAEDIESLFYFPVLSNKKLDNLIETINDLEGHISNGIYVYKSEKIKNTLSRCFTCDKNLFYSIYSIKSAYFNGKYPEFKMNYRTEMGIDIDESIFIDFKAVINKFTNYEVEIVKPVVEKSKFEIVNLDLVYDNSQKFVPLMFDFLKQDNLRIFVDCGNLTFFKFLTFIRPLSSENIKEIVLVMDENSNYLWREFEDYYDGDILIKSVNVPRLYKDRSAIDIVLTKEICESISLRKTENVLLVSNHSNFFGLISSYFNSNVNFGICYLSTFVGKDYLDFLKNNNISKVDLLTVKDNKYTAKYKTKAYTSALLNVVSSVSMGDWDIEYLTKSIYDLFVNEGITKQEIRDFISNNFEKIQINMRGNRIFLALNDICDYEINIH